MRLINHCLGLFAAFSVWLQSRRINMIPFNVLLIVCLAIFDTALWDRAIEAMQSSQTPLEVSVDQVKTGRGLKQKFVRVSGTLLPAALYLRVDGRVTDWWSPLLDAGGNVAILVRRVGTVDHEPAHPEQITGMVRRLHAEARNILSTKGNQIDGLPVISEWEIDAGEEPDIPVLAMTAAGAVTFILVCFCIVLLARHIIFQPARNLVQPIATEAITGNIYVNVSGNFRFDGVAERRLLDVVSVFSIERGQVVFRAKVNAEQRFMGLVTAQRNGVWYIAIKPGSVTNGQFGFLYFGLDREYAFRFKYTDSESGKVRKAVVCSDDRSLAQVAASLERVLTAPHNWAD